MLSHHFVLVYVVCQLHIDKVKKYFRNCFRQVNHVKTQNLYHHQYKVKMRIYRCIEALSIKEILVVLIVILVVIIKTKVVPLMLYVSYAINLTEVYYVLDTLIICTKMKLCLLHQSRTCNLYPSQASNTNHCHTNKDVTDKAAKLHVYQTYEQQMNRATGTVQRQL